MNCPTDGRFFFIYFFYIVYDFWCRGGRAAADVDGPAPPGSCRCSRGLSPHAACKEQKLMLPGNISWLFLIKCTMAPQLSVHRLRLSAFVFKSCHEMKNKFKANDIFVKRLFTSVFLDVYAMYCDFFCKIWDLVSSVIKSLLVLSTYVHNRQHRPNSKLWFKSNVVSVF